MAYSDATITDTASCFHESFVHDSVYCYLRVDGHSSIVFTYTEGVHTATSFAGVGNVRVGDIYGELGRASRIISGRYWSSFEWQTARGCILVYSRNSSVFARVTFIRFEG